MSVKKRFCHPTINQHDYDDIKQGALMTLERKIKSILAPAVMADVVDINTARIKAA